MPDPTYIACPKCGEPYAMTAMQKRLFHGRTLTCQRCAKPFAITEETPDPVPAPKAHVVAPTETKAPDVVELPPSNPTAASLERKIADRGEGLTAGKMALLICVVTAAVVFLLYVAMSPSLQRSREASRRVVCASNLTQIGTALQLYANVHGGKFPDTLDALVAAGYLPAEMLICPSTTHTPAPGKTPGEQAANLAKGSHNSYVYLGKGLGYGARKLPIVYEPLSHHANDGVHVLFTDGTVQFLPRTAAMGTLPQLAPPGVVPTTLPQTLPTR